MMINNNIFPGGGFADPHAIVENGRVYIFCGKDRSYKIDDSWRISKWCIISSDDLINWRMEGEILPEQTHIGSIQDNCWAGHIIKKNNKYYWFYSNRNIDIGVVVSDNIIGPYKQVIAKPLIPEDFSETRSYDPCIYEEDGVYTLFYGVNKYYSVELNDDLLSVNDEPKYILVLDEQGKEMSTDDKPTVFKRNGIYYLCFGDRYAVSRDLHGPYQLKGEFLGGGHNDVFTFQNQLYVCNEFWDTGIFYRGIRIMQLEFDEKGDVRLPDDNMKEVTNQRQWSFTENGMNWFLSDGKDCDYATGGICYVTDDMVGIRTAIFPGVSLQNNSSLQIELKCEEDIEIIIEVETVESREMCWEIPYTAEKHIVNLKKEITNYCVTFSYDEQEERVLRKLTLCGTKGMKNKKIVIKQISIQ